MNRQYEKRRQQIARREFLARQNRGLIPQSQNFDYWYGNTFLTDVIMLQMVLNEIGPEETYSDPTYEEEQQNEEADTETEQQYESNESDSSYDDSSPDDSFDSSDSY